MQVSIQPGQLDSRPFPTRNYFFVASYWFAISFLWGGFLSAILPVFNQPLAAPIFGINQLETARGIMSGIGLIIAMFVQPLAGAISDRSPHPLGRRRPYIIGGTVGIILSLAIVIFSGNWWLLLAGYVLLQFTDNIAQGAYQGLMPDVVPEDKRGKASAWLAISQLTGTLLGATLPGILQGSLGEIPGSQLMLVLVGIVFLISLTITVIFVKETPYQSAEKQSAWAAGIGMFKGIRQHPDFVILMVARFFFLTAPASVSLFVKSFLEGTANKNSPLYGLSFVRPTADAATGQLVAQAGGTLSLILGIVIFTAIAAAYPFSALSERTGRKRMIYVATAMGFVGAIGLLVPNWLILNAAETARTLSGFAAQQNYMDGVRPLAITLTIVFGACVGSSWGAFMSVDWAYATDLIPSGEAGRFMGLSNLATAGCQAFGAFLGGFVVDNLGYAALFLLIAVYYGLSALILTRVRETRGRPRQVE